VQVAAARFAAEAERKLASSYGVVASESARARHHASGLGGDVSKASRGALAGSGAFRGLGRSIAFASGGFLAFASAGQFLRTSIDAAKEAAVTQAQLAAQFRSAGRSLGPYQKEIDRTSERLSALSGFQNDELKAGFVTIFRTTGSVAKGLRDLAAAADLARAKHISLAQASLIIAKTEAGNTTLLRRQGFQIAKTAKSEEALAIVRRAVAGQARAGSTEQERFGATLHTTEEIIGTGLLPTLNKYLASGGKWLEQMNESGDLQRKVASAADAFAGAVSGVVSVVRTADRITGGFKHTIELLIGLKLASSAAAMARNFGIIGKSAETNAAKVNLLSASLKRFALAAAVVAGVDAILNAKSINEKLRDKIPGLAKIQDFSDKHIPGIHFLNNLAPDVGVNENTDKTVASIRISAAKVAKETTDFGVRVAHAITKAKDTIAAAGKFNATQRNTFFDNAISRILLRGGLGNVQQQIAALRKADTLIAQRLAVTKDITRRLNLEDELLQNQAQIRSLTGQQTADRLQAAEDARQKALDALARRATARNAAQFKALGLTATGETRAPSVRNLRNALGTLSDAVKGTFLDTSKTQSVFSQIRKVLSGNLGVVGRDVRLQIKQILSDLDQQLHNHSRSLTKFSHVNSQAIINAVGGDLTPEQRRRLRGIVSTIGAGGTVPGGRSLAFSAGTTVVHTNVNLDGERIAHTVTRHQRKSQTRRSDSRRGPYAGRN
jgi:hypothetical protein